MFGFKSKRVRRLEEQVMVLERDVKKLFDRNRMLACGPHSRFSGRHREWVTLEDVTKLILDHLKMDLRWDKPRGGGIRLISHDEQYKDCITMKFDRPTRPHHHGRMPI